MIFSTEFPISFDDFDRSQFVAQVVTWLRGNENCTIFNDQNQKDLDKEYAFLKAISGEELRLREIDDSGGFKAIGFRHDIPDSEGRLWRTEAVIRENRSTIEPCLIRFRTQCIAKAQGARLDTPLKPYLIKSILRDGLGGQDKRLMVSDQPIWLSEDDHGLDLAHAATLGGGSLYLPIIYISSTDENRHILKNSEINNLAFYLGGVAHVVVEPSRSFSFSLRETTEGLNVYGGAIGILLPNRGAVQRFFIDWRRRNTFELIESLKKTTFFIRSQMPAMGWDWIELQEHALHLQRHREKNRVVFSDLEALYNEEISILKEENRSLKDKINNFSQKTPEEFTGIISEDFISSIGREIYSGEFTDRISLACYLASKSYEQIGLDNRTKFILESISQHLPKSHSLLELAEDLKRATRDTRRASSELKSLLFRLGYEEKSEKRHLRLSPRAGYDGLDSITVAKTPSDHRSLENTRSQIERAIGLPLLLKRK